jgi:hypothetical protein
MAPFRLRHQTHVKEGSLEVEAAVAFDAQLGVSYGLAPKTWSPRLDFSVRTALFLKPPEQPSFLLGVIPRIRFSFWDSSTRVDGSHESTLSGMSFALGLCGSPYYDPDGLVLLICGEYGGGTVQVATRDRDSDFERTIDIGVGKASFSLEGEYDLPSVFHLALRTGVEFIGAGDYRIEDAAQNELFRLGESTFFATAGLGVHF